MSKCLFKKCTSALVAMTMAVPMMFGQNNAGHLSGDMMMNANFFQRDTAIGASGNPLYDKVLSGGESWMSLRYSNYGFTGFLRVDAFNNSNLQNPTQPNSGFGIGAWNINKDIGELSITAGYIYDQIGSGILFRSYEDRGLLIDNALAGIHLKYQINSDIHIKGFSGQQKNQLSRFDPIIKGLAAEGNFSIGENVFLSSGAGVLNRTLDENSMSVIVNSINSKPVDERFVPKYNTYAFTVYNTLSLGDLTWYIEGAYKTKEAINDYHNALMSQDGNILFTSLSYARKGVAVNFMGKRTQNFVLRTSPTETQPNGGMLNWQPIIAQVRPQRLIARYMPASQDLNELALNANILISPNDDYDFNLSYTHINTLDGNKLYREAYAEANIRSVSKTLIDIGLHYMQYNQDFYQFKPGVPMVNAVTPFAEVTYRINSRASSKLQMQYMHTKEDFGSWAFANLEYSIASKWSFAASDMYNIKPAKVGDKAQHYYNFFAAYMSGANRFTLAYVRQVEGINCTGGVCRWEPAFSGIKLGITSSF